MTEAPKRPDRGPEMDDFLQRVGWAGASRRFLAGDASFRRYERVHAGAAVAVLMDAPPPWEDVHPFLAVTEQLRRSDVSVPEILAADATQGFLLLEDLGDYSYTKLLNVHPEREREIYLAATDALVAIHHASREYRADFEANLPPYDEAVYLREAALFAEWFLPQIVGLEKAARLRAEFLALWREVLAAASLRQHCLVHRDYHADNLFWVAGRGGHHAVGMIDYQDALWGDAAYDLASLLEDARRDVGRTTMVDCFAHYVTQTGELAHGFAERYAVLAAQRNAKIIGIFTRLCVRDGKAHYLDYLPRVWGHFMHDISHPLLAPIRQFVDCHVPEAWRGAFLADASIGGIAP
ncbi:MAG: aminoglycoside phosphotransferase family protein [Rickettsiales bacterium]